MMFWAKKESMLMSELDWSLCERDRVLELLDSTDADEYSCEDVYPPTCNRRNDKYNKVYIVHIHNSQLITHMTMYKYN